MLEAPLQIKKEDDADMERFQQLYHVAFQNLHDIAIYKESTGRNVQVLTPQENDVDIVKRMVEKYDLHWLIMDVFTSAVSRFEPNEVIRYFDEMSEDLEDKLQVDTNIEAFVQCAHGHIDPLVIHTYRMWLGSGKKEWNVTKFKSFPRPLQVFLLTQIWNLSKDYKIELSKEKDPANKEALTTERDEIKELYRVMKEIIDTDN